QQVEAHRTFSNSLDDAVQLRKDRRDPCSARFDEADLQLRVTLRDRPEQQWRKRLAALLAHDQKPQALPPELLDGAREFEQWLVATPPRMEHDRHLAFVQG